jgi:hypothetical protein
MTISIRLPWLVTSSSSSSYSLFYYWSESLFWNRNVSNGPLCSSFFYDAGCRICYWPSNIWSQLCLQGLYSCEVLVQIIIRATVCCF